MVNQKTVSRQLQNKRAYATAFPESPEQGAGASGGSFTTIASSVGEGAFQLLCRAAYYGLALAGFPGDDEGDQIKTVESSRKEVKKEGSPEHRQVRSKGRDERQNATRKARHEQSSDKPTVEAKSTAPNPFDAARKAKLTVPAPRQKTALQDQYAALLKTRQGSLLNRPENARPLKVETSTASPVHKNIFAERRKRRQSIVPRTAQDGVETLQKMQPHTNRIAKRHTQLPFSPAQNAANRAAPGTPLAESPVHHSPLTAYRSPGTYLESPVPQPSVFKMKNGVQRNKKADADSLEDLVAQLRQEYPGEYKWHQIDARRKQRDAAIESMRRPQRKPLPKELQQRVSQILRGRVPADEVLIERFNQPVRADDLQTLRSGAWLNDEVINFYMNLINERAKADPNSAKVHCFNTFFYSNFLLPKGYAGVKRFAKRAKVEIAQCDLVLVPIHLGVHWCMSAVNRKEKRIEYWDSLRGGAGRVHAKLREYMRNEDQAFAAEENNWVDWIPPAHEAPMQQNGYDCGVFASSTAECLARGGPIDFDQEDMEELRVRMAASILEAKIY